MHHLSLGETQTYWRGLDRVGRSIALGMANTLLSLTWLRLARRFSYREAKAQGQNG